MITSNHHASKSTTRLLELQPRGVSQSELKSAIALRCAVRLASGKANAIPDNLKARMQPETLRQVRSPLQAPQGGPFPARSPGTHALSSVFT